MAYENITEAILDKIESKTPEFKKAFDTISDNDYDDLVHECTKLLESLLKSLK